MRRGTGWLFYGEELTNIAPLQTAWAICCALGFTESIFLFVSAGELLSKQLSVKKSVERSIFQLSAVNARFTDPKESCSRMKRLSCVSSIQLQPRSCSLSCVKSVVFFSAFWRKLKKVKWTLKSQTCYTTGPSTTPQAPPPGLQLDAIGQAWIFVKTKICRNKAWEHICKLFQERRGSQVSRRF